MNTNLIIIQVHMFVHFSTFYQQVRSMQWINSINKSVLSQTPNDPVWLMQDKILITQIMGLDVDHKCLSCTLDIHPDVQKRRLNNKNGQVSCTLNTFTIQSLTERVVPHYIVTIQACNNSICIICKQHFVMSRSILAETKVENLLVPKITVCQ